jgi:hypothetical protein
VRLIYIGLLSVLNNLRRLAFTQPDDQSGSRPVRQLVLSFSLFVVSSVSQTNLEKLMSSDSRKPFSHLTRSLRWQRWQRCPQIRCCFISLTNKFGKVNVLGFKKAILASYKVPKMATMATMSSDSMLPPVLCRHVAAMLRLSKP